MNTAHLSFECVVLLAERLRWLQEENTGEIDEEELESFLYAIAKGTAPLQQMPAKRRPLNPQQFSGAADAAALLINSLAMPGRHLIQPDRHHSGNILTPRFFFCSAILQIPAQHIPPVSMPKKLKSPKHHSTHTVPSSKIS